MKEETALYLAKAREDLVEAKAVAGIGFAQAAARAVYYATFHAAEAFIFEKTGRPVKTHSGVRAEFARLTRVEFDMAQEVLGFLSRSYKYKEVADYAIRPRAQIGTSDLHDLIVRADILVSAISTYLAGL